MQDARDVQIQQLIEENKRLYKIIEEQSIKIKKLEEKFKTSNFLKTYVNCRNEAFRYENKLIF
jgi:hypothetical protein